MGSYLEWAVFCGCGAQDVTTSSSGGGLSGDHTEVLTLGQRHNTPCHMVPRYLDVGVVAN